MLQNKRVLVLICATLLAVVLLGGLAFYQGLSHDQVAIAELDNIIASLKETVYVQQQEKMFRLYTSDANLLFLLREYKESDNEDKRIDMLYQLLEWSGVAESVSYEFRSPLLFPNLSPDNYKLPYVDIKTGAKNALLDNEELKVDYFINFLEAKLIYNIHYDAVLGVEALLTEENKALLIDGIDVAKRNYYDTLLESGHRFELTKEQSLYLTEVFYELELNLHYGDSNLIIKN